MKRNTLGLVGLIAILFMSGCVSPKGKQEQRNLASPQSEGELKILNPKNFPLPSFSHLKDGERFHVHGMVLFGAGPFFMEHIPMLNFPHDFQVVAMIEFKDRNGKILTIKDLHQIDNRVPEEGFTKTAFSIKPETFSLNDLIAGRKKSFSGLIHQGNFEEKNKVLLDKLGNVSINVLNILYAHQLPRDESNGTFYEVKDNAQNTFYVNIISSARSVQGVQNVTLNKNLWCVVGPDFFNSCSRELVKKYFGNLRSSK